MPVGTIAVGLAVGAEVLWLGLDVGDCVGHLLGESVVGAHVGSLDGEVLGAAVGTEDETIKMRAADASCTKLPHDGSFSACAIGQSGWKEVLLTIKLASSRNSWC
jgi:hypothetical protein